LGSVFEVLDEEVEFGRQACCAVEANGNKTAGEGAADQPANQVGEAVGEGATCLIGFS
jgi:hypothetical protein